MNSRTFNPIIGLLLLVLVGIGGFLALRASGKGKPTDSGNAAQASPQSSPNTLQPILSPAIPLPFQTAAFTLAPEYKPTKSPSSDPTQVIPSTAVAHPSQTAPPLPTAATAEPTHADPIVPVVPTGTYSPVIQPEPTADPTQVVREQQLRHLSDVIHNRPGVVIAQGSNATPVGKAGVLSYTVEEVSLSEPLNFGIDERGNDLIASKFWRITISANQMRMGALAYYIHLNDQQVSICGEQTGGCMGIVLKQELLVEGAQISLSYGGLLATDLPERLHFSIAPGTASYPGAVATTTSNPTPSLP